MRFALVNGQRQEAQPDLSGVCPFCESRMVAKCGEARARIWHWAHKGRRHCDPWWEETEWHLAWKNQFPADWQEFPQLAENGERHIADVKTDRGWVIEFQHSPIELEERRSREAFYGKLIWVVDGTGKRARTQLLKAWEEGVSVGRDSRVRNVFSAFCGLIEKWVGSNAPVFLDLGEMERLWWLVKGDKWWASVAPCPVLGSSTVIVVRQQRQLASSTS